jgi:hypothetical protein
MIEVDDELVFDQVEFAEVMGQAWQGMDNAPKSPVVNGSVQGIYLLAFVPAGPDDEPFTDLQVGVRIVWWEPFMACWYDGLVEVQPTHWMPLPLAPQAGFGAAGVLGG